jgi:hypothetical protein
MALKSSNGHSSKRSAAKFHRARGSRVLRTVYFDSKLDAALRVLAEKEQKSTDQVIGEVLAAYVSRNLANAYAL